MFFQTVSLYEWSYMVILKTFLKSAWLNKGCAEIKWNIFLPVLLLFPLSFKYLSFFKNLFYFTFMWMDVLLECLYMHHILALSLWRSEEGSESHRSELPHGCWVLNLGSLHCSASVHNHCAISLALLLSFNEHCSMVIKMHGSVVRQSTFYFTLCHLQAVWPEQLLWILMSSVIIIFLTLGSLLSRMTF